MNPKPIEHAKNPLLALALPALVRARKRAEDVAIATNTAVVEIADGELTVVPADDLRAAREARE